MKQITRTHIRNKLYRFLKYVLFLAVGVIIFWFIYKDLDVQVLLAEMEDLRYGWLIGSVLIGMISHLIRAYRWKMLIAPMGYHPRTINTFLSIMVMYLTNLIIPRGGEFARCGILSRYESVPFSKLVGTMVVERVTDVIALVLFAITILVLQFNVFHEFFLEHPEIKQRIFAFFTPLRIGIAGGLVVMGMGLLLFYKTRFKSTKLYNKFSEFIDNLIMGVKTIRHLRKSWLYIVYTILIYLFWLIMLYVVFFSYEPTQHLSLLAGWAAFVMSGIAMIAPIQAGIGPWHFMVYETLVIYGIEKTHGKIFALIAHTTTNLSLLIVGLAALLILPVINSSRK